MKQRNMTNEDLKQELIKLIKYYQMITYNYRQYPNYSNAEVTWDEAERRLEYYNEKYCELLNF